MQLLFTLPARRISSTAEEAEEAGKEFLLVGISAKLV
jgi:hypothetical protein